MDVGKKIKAARIAKGMTQEELGKALGLQKSAIAKYENGRVINIKRSTLQQISKILNIRPAELIDDEELDFSKIDNIIPLPKTKKVPLLGTIACGEPILADENIESFINMPEDVGATFALKCKGDSMINARIFDGDIVYIREQPDVENGEIAAVLIGDEATLKKVYKYPGRIELRAENPTMKTLEFEGEEINSIRILGKAVYFISRVI